MLWLIFDYLGTIAFAISGTLVGIQRRMDIFGVAMLALATAVGGGMIRDTLVGNTPPVALRDPSYIVVSLLTVCILFFASAKIRRHTRRGKMGLRLYLVADTIGLASFTVTGASVGFHADPHSGFLLPIVLGLITACGGGVIRDISALRIPAVFRSDVYASASLAGGFGYCLMRYIDLWDWAALVAFGTVVLFRSLAIYYHWQLPRPRR